MPSHSGDSNERWAVICGVVRDEAAMLSKLTTLESWRREGALQGVVFSTWRGELDQYPAVREAIERLGVVLVEIEPPIIKMGGFFLHQTKALWYGVQATPLGCKVLKLRPDIVAINDEIKAAILGSDLSIGETEWPKVFNERVMIAAAFPDGPYYFNDIIFYGAREDLLEIASLDISTEILCVNTATEQQFFRKPFAQKFPRLEALLQIYPCFIFNNPKGARARMELLLSSNFFLEAFSTQVHVLHQYFRLGFQSDAQRDQEARAPFMVAELFHKGLQFPGVERHEGASATVFRGEGIIKALIEKRFEMDELGRRLAAAIDKTSDIAGQRAFSANPLRPDPSVRDLQAKLLQAMPGSPTSVDYLHDPSGLKYMVRGHPERVSLAETSDSGKEMEREVNHLRRLVERLQEELKASRAR